MSDARQPLALTALPAPQETLTHTNWAGLDHALGPATNAPEMLAGLLDTSQAVRTRALHDVYGLLHHQNTIYPATVPTALYVAAILPDPRTTRSVDKDSQAFPGNIRAELLAWVDSVGTAVTDEADASGRRIGFPLDEDPPSVAVRAIRPLLFSAALDYVDDTDRYVREAAIAACIPLADDPRLRRHRADLVPLVRQVLGSSQLWQHRERAIDALDAWGEDSSGLEGQRNPFLFCDTDLAPGSFAWRADSIEGFSEEPPF
ncbi:hypothetical protein [Streptomyces chartreusis]|uniref:hypothetical protein n=1 Tax=Streptomyces chartreusis TaxID=1969 RepID=UPI0037FCB238